MLRLTIAGSILLACAAGPSGAQEVFRASGTAPGLGFSYAVPQIPIGGGEYTRGHMVVRVVPEGSNAARAGLAAGDTIVAVNGRDSRERPLFPDRTPGTRYTLRVRREGEELEIEYALPEPAARTN